MRTLLSPCAFMSAALVLTGCYRVAMPGLRFTPDTRWIREDPTSEHRMIQYRLRGEYEETGDARLVVYHFGEQRDGGLEANVARWAGQFRQADGRPSIEVARVNKVEVNGIEVHTMQLEGTYVAEMAPGSGEGLDLPGRSLRATIVFSDAGAYYFKVVGPTATVKRWDASYDMMIASLRALPVPE